MISKGRKKQRNASSKYQLQVVQIQASGAAVVDKNAKVFANTQMRHTYIDNSIWKYRGLFAKSAKSVKYLQDLHFIGKLSETEVVSLFDAEIV